MAAVSSSSTATTMERRGIPGAQFVEDVQTYLTQSNLDGNGSALSVLQERSFVLISFRRVLFLLPLIGFVLGLCLLSLLGGFDVGKKRRGKERPFRFELIREFDLWGKIPDIEKCLDVVATLQEKKDIGEELIADFEVSEGIYSRACIHDMESVFLWLGANVVLEYSLEEATSPLQKNIENAKASPEVLLGDLQYCEINLWISVVVKRETTMSSSLRG